MNSENLNTRHCNTDRQIWEKERNQQSKFEWQLGKLGKKIAEMEQGNSILRKENIDLKNERKRLLNIIKSKT